MENRSTQVFKCHAFIDLNGIKKERETKGSWQHWHIKMNNTGKNKKKTTGSLPRMTNLGAAVFLSVKGPRSDQGGTTKWIMGTGEISWSDKPVVLASSALRTAPQQETDKGEPEALHSNPRHGITRHY